MKTLLQTDRQVFQLLNQEWTAGWLDPVMVFLTMISEHAFFWWVIAVVLFVFRRKIGSVIPAVTLISSLAVTFLIRNAVAFLVDRPRPPLSEENARQLVELPISPSFPSTHAATSFAAMYVLLYFFPSARYWAIPLAVIFAYTRLYVGVHFPTDSLAGAFLGIILAAVTTGVITSRVNKKQPHA
ncbi:phosphatase PAP2 family protein [Alkalicoccus saliphilus]|uniref:UDP-diphosphatase n=1 Tax=Alkalicoccus saliphilus TaxID=200989 RepID=A0A2T4U2I9_9BACI|nr:phosphatase PAP2 family protein [Alkalicoccus saliphilus]PTL37620.1 UDP-diphosphatase [Alkalicoccus saliphilus]